MVKYIMNIIEAVESTSSLEDASKLLGISKAALHRQLVEAFPEKNNKMSWKNYLNTYLTESNIAYIKLNYAVGPEKLAQVLNKPMHIITSVPDARILEYWGIRNTTSTFDRLAGEFRGACARLKLKYPEALQYLNKKYGEQFRKNNGGSKTEQPTYLYICYFPLLRLYKVGITVDWEVRKGTFGTPVELLSLLKGENYFQARALESYILWKAPRYNSGLLPSGNTETYKFT